ncbi:MAG: hypothetical protein V8Q36_05630 [Anaerotignum sp.]
MDYEEILKTISRWMKAYTLICDKDDSPLFQLEPPATGKKKSPLWKSKSIEGFPTACGHFFSVTHAI